VILSKLRLFPAPEQRRETLATLRSVQGPTQAEPSCSASQVYEEDGPEAAILYVEEWKSESEFQDHVRSSLYRRILAAIDLSKSAPEIGIYQISNVQGLELIQQIRESGGKAPTNAASSR
jgi:quinol monooxygenase YgiN